MASFPFTHDYTFCLVLYFKKRAGGKEEKLAISK